MTSQCPYAAILDIVAGTLCWIILAPVLLPFVLIALLCRSVSLLWAYILYPTGQLEALSYYDIAAGVQELGLLIAYPLHAEGKINLEKLRSHFNSTFIKDGQNKKYPVFYYNSVTILGYGYKRKVTETLDLKHHIRERILTPGETLEQVAAQVVAENDKLRGPTIPKWEIVVLQDQVQGRSTLIFKISHALADAYSYFFLLNKLTGTKNNYVARPLKPSFFRQISILLKAPYTFIRWNREVSVGNKSKLQFGGDISSARGLTAGTPNAKLWSNIKVDFSRIKQISKLTRTRVHSVLMAIHYGALRRGAESLFGYKLDETTVKEPLSVTFMLPMPNHPAIVEGKCTNHMSWGTMNLHLNKPDRLSQLFQIQTLFDKSIMSDLPQIINLCYRTAAFFLPKNLLIMYESSKVNPNLQVITPFVAPEKFSILGIPVHKMQLLFNGDDIPYANGIVFGSVTQGDEMQITVASSHQLFISQEELDNHVQKLIPQEIEKLLQDCKTLK